jgi:hypothetical protein
MRIVGEPPGTVFLFGRFLFVPIVVESSDVRNRLQTARKALLDYDTSRDP